MTRLEVLRRLQDAKIENPAHEAALLLEHFCKASTADFDEVDYQSPALEEAIQKRCAHVPLQYLLGEWGFFRETYLVTPDCLIPRSDTELLVEEANCKAPTPAAVFSLILSAVLAKSVTFAIVVTGALTVTVCADPSTVKRSPSERIVPSARMTWPQE